MEPVVTCTDCGNPLPVDNPPSYKRYCRSCKVARTQAWRRANPEQRRVQSRKDGARKRARAKTDPSIRAKLTSVERRHRLKKQFGLTPERYADMVTQQNGCCAICGNPTPALEIDHNHTTGDVRELLCGLCNRGLGNFKDDPERLLKAVEYVRRHPVPGKVFTG